MLFQLSYFRKNLHLKKIWQNELDFFLKKMFRLSGEEFIQQVIIPAQKKISFSCLMKLVYYTWLKKKNYPWEYIFQEAFFLKRKFFITRKTFIPRPETEELMRLILKRERKIKKRILELGTGSGVIAISLKKAFPEAEIVAVDICPHALAVAQKNAQSLLKENEKIEFLEKDAFDLSVSRSFEENPFDLVVTNPPYVGEKEKHLISKSTLRYEPKKALFSGESGLDFFLKLAPLVGEWLKRGGRFYAEMGFQQAEAVSKIFHSFSKKKVLRDMFGKERFFLGEK